MKYLNIFQDTIEHFPDLLSAVYVAASPWFPNKSLSSNLEPEIAESLASLADAYKTTPEEAINQMVLEKGTESFQGSLFLWCEVGAFGISLHGLTFPYSASARDGIGWRSSSVMSGSLFCYQPEGGKVKEVEFIQKLMEEAWGDPTLYDVAISFAGDEREYVRELAEFLKSRNILVFFDEFEQSKMWGQDGLEYLQNAYVSKAKYVIVCISAAYMERAWPTYERKQILGREFIKQDSSILPLRFDDTEIESLPPQYFYLDARTMPAQMVGQGKSMNTPLICHSL